MQPAIFTDTREQPQSPTSLRRLLRQLSLVGLGILLLGMAVPAWRHYAPVKMLSGWHMEVLDNQFIKPSALAFDNHGNLLITEELPNGTGELLLRDASGQQTLLLDGLSKPDGLITVDSGVVLSQEGGEHSVMLLRNDGQIEKLFTATNVEGLAAAGDHIYAVEDLHTTGRLLRYDLGSQELVVLRDDLQEPEGITVCPSGRVIYSEKTTGKVLELNPEGKDLLVLQDLNQPGFLMCNQAGLWITEDATHVARLLLLDPQGGLTTVANHLRSAQTLVESPSGQYYLTEQGRQRILKLSQPQESI